MPIFKKNLSRQNGGHLSRQNGGHFEFSNFSQKLQNTKILISRKPC